MTKSTSKSGGRGPSSHSGLGGNWLGTAGKPSEGITNCHFISELPNLADSLLIRLPEVN